MLLFNLHHYMFHYMYKEDNTYITYIFHLISNYLLMNQHLELYQLLLYLSIHLIIYHHH